jgi:hypothetical protein
MSSLRNLRNLFSQLSVNELQTVRGGAAVIDQTGNNQTGNNQTGNYQIQGVSALDDNKRPERPGGGVSTH